MNAGLAYFLIFLVIVGLGYGIYTFTTNQTTVNIKKQEVDLGTVGLSAIDVIAGSGPMTQKGDTLVVNYTGKLEDGTEFDSSYKHGAPFSFRLGAGGVIPGWDQGLVGMQKGATRRLVVAPDLAYGSRGIEGVIPPNATLLFEITLLDINPTK